MGEKTGGEGQTKSKGKEKERNPGMRDAHSEGEGGEE